ncbi:MAG: sigma-54-dependent transcriptional regulator [Kiloniellaceae bacterium]
MSEIAERQADAQAVFSPWLAQASILVVDDAPGMRNFLVRTLGPRCQRLEAANDAAAATRLLENSHFDVVIIDNLLPGQSGLEWLQEQRRLGFFSEVILITAFADLETAIDALRAGAADFVLKPFRSNQILNAVARCLDRMRLRRENVVLRYELDASDSAIRVRNRLIGRSPRISEVRETIERVAPMPTSVMITGESGSGKEVAARLVHALSSRAEGPFVPLNCAAIPAEMIESELFGHVKGAFTGAESLRQGLFLYAQGGTIFLDEIAEMPLALQSKLLRILDDKRVRPLGTNREVPVDVRLVFATNADLEVAVAEGRFRADLFYRLNVVRIEMPQLRERRDDIDELAALFMSKVSVELGVPPLLIDDGVRAALQSYDWPGNVRELRNTIERALILGRFPPEFRGGEEGGAAPAAESLEAVEKRHILKVLADVGGNRAAAARILGVSRKTIERKCAAWNV